MAIKSAFRQVLNSGIDQYNKPLFWNICGVRICYKPVSDGVSASEWKETFETWLPRFEDAGWLDKFQKIVVAEDAAKNNAVGEYRLDGIIFLDNDVSAGLIKSAIVDDTREHVLAHEMVHHAHMTLADYNGGYKKSNNEALIKQDVSYYAGTNIYESIAEIGAGIIHGVEYPDWIHDHYESHDGPREVYDIG